MTSMNPIPLSCPFTRSISSTIRDRIVRLIQVRMFSTHWFNLDSLIPNKLIICRTRSVDQKVSDKKCRSKSVGQEVSIKKCRTRSVEQEVVVSGQIVGNVSKILTPSLARGGEKDEESTLMSLSEPEMWTESSAAWYLDGDLPLPLDKVRQGHDMVAKQGSV